MATRFMVLPYSAKSEGAKLIAEAIGGKRIKLENSDYVYKAGDCVVNWGNGHGNVRIPKDGLFLNRDVNVCINKLDFFLRMQGHAVAPPFATGKNEAMRHLEFPIVCRTVLEGADGAGIVIADHPKDLVPAKLYTQFLEKKAEYRIHMGRDAKGEVILIAAQLKRKLKDYKVGRRIWTGEAVVLDYVERGQVPDGIRSVTKKAMKLLPELAFGGFDVIDTTTHGARVVEVNSAPLMTPLIVRKYAEFIQKYAADKAPKEVFAKPVARVAAPAAARVAVKGAPMEGEQGEILQALLRIERLLIRQ